MGRGHEAFGLLSMGRFYLLFCYPRICCSQSKGDTRFTFDEAATSQSVPIARQISDNVLLHDRSNKINVKGGLRSIYQLSPGSEDIFLRSICQTGSSTCCLREAV